MKLVYCTSIAFSNKLANLVQVHAMAKEFQKKLGKDFYLGVNYKNIDDENIQFSCFNTNKSYILAWRYLKFIREKNINYIYCREARLLFFIIIFNKLFIRRKINITYEIHALPLGGLLSGLIESLLVKGVDNFIFITRNLRDIYVKRFRCLLERTLIASDAVDLSIFNIDISKQEARERLELPQDPEKLPDGNYGAGKKILGYMGRFKTMGMDKGIGVILKALPALGNDVLFIAVGGNKHDLPEYEAEAEKLGVSNKAKFFGNVEQGILAIYQKACDLLLMPFPRNEHYAYYMSPLKMFEYMASKRPIIATDLPSIREVLSEKNAIIVKPGDSEDLVRGIKEILGNKELADQISQQAFRDVNNYTWEKRVGSILDFIK